MDSKVVGTTLPVLEVSLSQGESIVAEAGQMSWMTGSIELRTSTQLGGAKGVFGVLKRAVGGGSIFMTEYSAQGSPGMVAFATRMPGQILPIEITSDRSYLVHPGGLVCATHGIEVTVGFQRRLGAGIFGGAGFILQKLAGTSRAWVELDGEVVVYDLAPGETVRVQPGHVGMFEERVNFDITMIKGIKNMLFGAETLFLASLTGPGKVWLQSLPLANLAHALSPYLSRDSTTTSAAAGGVAGAAIGGLSGIFGSDGD